MGRPGAGAGGLRQVSPDIVQFLFPDADQGDPLRGGELYGLHPVFVGHIADLAQGRRIGNPARYMGAMA